MDANSVVEVDRAKPGETRVVDHELEPLGEDQVRLRVDRFALTANNITYAVMGDLLGYWDFFPTGDPAWGRVPAMGWADVVDSTHPDVPAGGRYYGWFPQARFVDLTVSPIDNGLRDDGAHRQAHAAIYRQYVDTTRDPMYPADADDVGDAEDRHALLRGLFLTGFLADAFFANEDYYGAEATVVLSASGKTAIGFAQLAAEHTDVVGVTSPGNVDFVRSLGCYADVVTYDDVASLPVVPTVAVDMAGVGATAASLHAHLGDQLKYSMVIGASHHDAPPAEVTAGPRREFFFAPTEAGRLLDLWGREDFGRRTAEAMATFTAASHDWLTVERSSGPAATEATWRAVFDGSVPPSVGRIASVQD